MELWDGIRHWGGRLDWRRHAPVAGSIAAHGVVALAVTTILAASGKTLSPVATQAELVPLEVALLADSLPAPSERVPTVPRPAPLSKPAVDTAPIPPAPRKDERQLPVASTPEPAPADSVYLGPSPFAEPARKGGLDGLATNDPCTARIGIKPKDCAKNWSAAVGSMDTVMPRSEKDLRTYHAEFMTKCELLTGCGPHSGVAVDGILNNGARSFGLKSPMASGAGGVQGINELVGRLPQKQDYVDPGFGD